MKPDWGNRWNLYLFFVFAVFMAGFFFLPTRVHRNFFYLFLVVPFLVALPRIEWRNLFRSKILWISLVYIGYTALSALWGSNTGLKEVGRVFRHGLTLSVFVLLCTYLLSRHREKIPLFYKILCSAAGIAGAATILWFYWISPEGMPLAARLLGPEQIDHPNKGGTAFAIVALICHFGLGTSELPKRWKGWLFAVTVIAMAYLLLTQSRGPLLAFLAAMAVGALLRKDRKILITGGLFAAGFLLCILAGIYNPLERSDSFRLEIWKTSFGMIAQHPIFGHGAHSFDIPVTFGFGGAVKHSHNVFINNAVESGLVGVILLLVLLGGAMTAAAMEFRKEGNVLPFTLLVFFCVAAFSDGGSLVRSPHYQWLHFWFPVGLAMAYECVARAPVRSSALPEESAPSACEGVCHG